MTMAHTGVVMAHATAMMVVMVVSRATSSGHLLFL